MIATTVCEAENVFASLCHHRPSCKLVDAGEHGLSLPLSVCDCGALWAKLSREVHACHNIVTNTAGNIYYAEVVQLGIFTIGTAGATIVPANDFSEMVVSTGTGGGTAGDTAATMADPVTTRKAIAGGYPVTNDTDVNNPGAPTTSLMVTWKTEFTTSEAIATLGEVCIGESGTTYNGVLDDPILMRAAFASTFTKTTSDTLTVYVNHTFVGQP